MDLRYTHLTIVAQVQDEAKSVNGKLPVPQEVHVHIDPASRLGKELRFWIEAEYVLLKREGRI